MTPEPLPFSLFTRPAPVSSPSRPPKPCALICTTEGLTLSTSCCKASLNPRREGGCVLCAETETVRRRHESNKFLLIGYRNHVQSEINLPRLSGLARRLQNIANVF